ncbi:MAG: tetraacyldisaccharide 4'-kinase [Calditrichaeota bacterium]|nr:MAG: tetraacyldisaccharide 4'-kinase [Calditrichota bacterium]
MNAIIRKILKSVIWILLPLGVLHWVIVYIRNFLYDHHILKISRLPLPVISIGNLQMGGTGKTPLTIEMISYLQSKNYRVGVLTRGYKRKSKEPLIVTSENESSVELLGDEPSIILKHLKNGVLGVGRDRFQVGQKMLMKHDLDVLVLDDGYQHRQLHRDMDVCLIDVSRWSNHPFLFPFSFLRDTRSSLKRADVLVCTRAENNLNRLTDIENQIHSFTEAPILTAKFVLEDFYTLEGKIIPGEEVQTFSSFGAFCGIGNPHQFYDFLEKSLGFHLEWKWSFPDHFWYDDERLLQALNDAREKGVEVLFTTEKDALKLFLCKESLGNWQQNIWVVKVRLEVDKFEFITNRVEENIKRYRNQKKY